MALQLAVFALGITRGAAAFPTSRLVYARGPGAEGCPDQDAVRKAVASRLGYDPFFPSSDKTIVARILRDSDHLRGEVELVDEHGAQLGLREFSADANKCDDLVRAMALSISIAIDPKSAETYAQGPPDEPPSAEDSATPKPAEPAPPSPPPHPEAHAAPKAVPHAAPPTTQHDLVWSAGVGAMVMFGAAPKSTLGGLGFASARTGAWSLALEGQADLPVQDVQRNVKFRTSSYALSAVPCVHFGAAFACELTALGWINATGTEGAANSGTGWLFSVGARLGAELTLTRSFGLVAEADLLASPWRVQLKANQEPLWETQTVSEGLGLAAAFHFP